MIADVAAHAPAAQAQPHAKPIAEFLCSKIMLQTEDL